MSKPRFRKSMYELVWYPPPGFGTGIRHRTMVDTHAIMLRRIEKLVRQGARLISYARYDRVTVGKVRKAAPGIRSVGP